MVLKLFFSQAHLLLASTLISIPTSVNAMRFATYNLRFDSMPNNITVQQSLDALPDPLVQPQFLNVTTEQPWSTRRIRVAEYLLSEGIEIAGFQEALVRQVDDLAELFGDDWAWDATMVSTQENLVRSSTRNMLPWQAIHFRLTITVLYRSSLTLVSNDTFWTSNTPFEPSKFPGAGSFRLCTVAHFVTTGSTPQNFTLLNTHMDDQSDDQRRLAASLILTRARFEAVNTSGPVLVSGDFNSESTGSSSGAYSIITGALPPVSINQTFADKFAVGSSQQPNFTMIDLRGQAPRSLVSQNYATFTGFTQPGDTSEWTRIDFLFGGSNGGWTADAYKVGTSLSDDGTLASDHRPVFVDISF